MSELYPLKFKTQFKEKIWGGNKIKTILGKEFSPLPNCGETWEISSVKGNISEVENGELMGFDLITLIETYKEKLVGNKVYEKFGNEFPLLIKFLDANDDLSIQVHPDDVLAKKRHNSFGKTEMWYVFQADEGAKLNTGFLKKTSKDEYLKHLNNNTLAEILNFETVSIGDVFFLPAGRVHYIGKGICLAEIQQTSDITYRIYDFDRKDDKGNLRELHTDLALDAIDYGFYPQYKTDYNKTKNESVNLVTSTYFVTNLIDADVPVYRNYQNIDSFIIYICVDGEATIQTDALELKIKKGDTVLLPAITNSSKILPFYNTKILEVWIPN